MSPRLRRASSAGLVAVAVVAGLLLMAAEWSNTTGVLCSFSLDFPAVPPNNCGPEYFFGCPGARPRAAIATGYEHLAFTDGFALNCHVEMDNVAMCETCCGAPPSCDPPDAGYHLRIFNP